LAYETCSSPEKQSNNKESIGIKQQIRLGKKSKANKIDLLYIGKSSALLSRGHGQKSDCKENLKNKHYKSDSYLIR
jgi:hypothetical protein